MSRRTRLLPRFYRYMLESDASTHRKGTALNVLSGLLTGVGLAIMMPAAVALQTGTAQWGLTFPGWVAALAVVAVSA